MNRRVSTALIFVLGGVQLLSALVFVGALMSWEFANPFRYISDPMLLQLESPELNLLLGTTLYLLTSLFLVALLEEKWTGRHDSSRAPLLGVIPIVGVASHFRLRPDKSVGEGEEKPKKPGQIAPAAVVIVLAVTMAVFGAYFVSQVGKSSDSKQPTNAAEANREAFLSIEKIQKAQDRYKQKDWDGDDKKEFALFVVHLWRTGRLKSDPIDVDLLPEELAVARGPETAYHGYSFRNLHYRKTAPPDLADETSEPQLQNLDYTKEWSLTAEPQFPPIPDDHNQRLQFLALSDGRIFARPSMGNTIDAVPFDCEKSWSPVKSIDDIEALQGSQP